MPEYLIFDTQDPQFPISDDGATVVIEATDEREALALYAVSQGFADPRGVDEGEYGEQFFNVFDGTLHMVYTNTELTAMTLQSYCDPTSVQA